MPAEARYAAPRRSDANAAARLLLVERGMDGMPPRLERLHTSCPACARSGVPALPGSTLTIAWYACTCGHFWSARIRDGRPVEEPAALPALPARPRSPV